VRGMVDEVAKAGGTPLVVAEDKRVLGVIQPKDIVKGGIQRALVELRRMGIRTVMITATTRLPPRQSPLRRVSHDFLARPRRRPS